MIRKDSLVTGFSVALGVAALLLLLFLGWRLLTAIGAMITPFIAALVLAILLDPLADRLEAGIPQRWPGSRRLWAVLLVFLGLLMVLAGLLAFIVPNLIAQTSRLITFFAPLVYKVERTRGDGRFIVIEKEATGSNYTVRGLQNGQSYRFRVVVKDSEGKEYLLTETAATPHVTVERKSSGVKNAKETARAIKNADQEAPSPVRNATEDDNQDLLPLPTSTPRPSPPPLLNLFPSRTVSPVPSATPAGEEVDDLVEEPSSLPSPVASVGPEPTDGEQKGAIGTVNEGSPSPALPPSPVAPDATPGIGRVAGTLPSPLVTPLAPLAMATPSPRSSAPTVGRILPQRPTPTATPLPSATPLPTPTAVRSKPSPLPSPTMSAPPAASTSRLPEPGTVLAVPGDGSVRLSWRPPVQAASGFDRLRTQADQWLLEHHSIGPVRLPPNLAAIQAQYSAQLSQLVQQVSQRAADIIVGSVSTALTVTLSLIIGFYLLADFDRLRMRLFHLIPEQARGSVLQTLTDVTGVFGNYVRGMTSVASLYGLVSIGVFFALGMFFDIGLRQYALLLGVIAGVLYPVPFLGPIVTTLMVTAVALATGATPIQAVIVAGTVQVQNGIFDNVVTPRVVGNSVGLHPLVTIFALLLGGQLFGLFGMLLSVPIAASIQKFLIRLYPHLGEPTPMVLQNPEHREKRRDSATVTDEGDTA